MLLLLIIFPQRWLPVSDIQEIKPTNSNYNKNQGDAWISKFKHIDRKELGINNQIKESKAYLPQLCFEVYLGEKIKHRKKSVLFHIQLDVFRSYIVLTPSEHKSTQYIIKNSHFDQYYASFAPKIDTMTPPLYFLMAYLSMWEM